MTLTLDDWHDRFLQQARWTESLRAHIFTRIDMHRARRILEVGCGTGAITASAAGKNPSVQVVGLDRDFPRLLFAIAHDRTCEYAAGDAMRLPFGGGEFDLAFCHYLLLWIRKPEDALREMARVTRPGGWVAAMAEPDYGGRIDYPERFVELGGLQRTALQRQGADPDIGRRVADLFHRCNLKIVETGILGARWTFPEDEAEVQSEWKILLSDLGGAVPAERLEAIRQADRTARQNGTRILFLPTLYCLAQV